MRILQFTLLLTLIFGITNCVNDKEERNQVNILLAKLDPTDKRSIDMFVDEIAELGEEVIPILLTSCNDSFNQSKNKTILDATFNLSKSNKVFNYLLEFSTTNDEFEEGIAVYFLMKLLYGIKDDKLSLVPPAEILTIYINAITNSSQIPIALANADIPSKINELSSFQLLLWTEFRDKELEQLIIPDNVEIVSEKQAISLKENLDKWFSSHRFKWNKNRYSFGSITI